MAKTTAILVGIALFAIGLDLYADEIESTKSPIRTQANDRNPAPETSSADKLKENPDDLNALKAYLSEMERNIKFLADQDAAKEAGVKLEEMKKLLESLHPATEEAKLLLRSNKRLMESLELDVELARTSLRELEAKLDANPHDQKALNDYTTKVFRLAYRVMRSDPDRADAAIKACRECLAKVRVSADDSLKKQLDGTEKHLAEYDSHIAASRELLALVGTDALPLHIEAWVNGAPVADANLKGKVVLLDFWAVRCGPCIRGFPKLREWHAQYGDKGLVIIGITDYFNYAWNEETGSAEKLESPVSPEQEQAMLEKFAAQHDLPFRIGIQTGVRALDSEMAKHYKVNGLPFVVVIDQTGKVRLLRAGSDQQNAKDIEALLQKLLSSPPADHPEIDTRRQD